MFIAADIGDSVQRLADTFFEWLPRLVGALVILLIAWIVAKAVQRLIDRYLPRTGMDRAVHAGTHGQYVARYAPGFKPSAVIAQIAYWIIFLMGVLLALSTLGIEALDNFIGAVVGYLPNVIAAILILVVAIAIAGTIAGVVGKLMGDTTLGKIVAAVAPILVMTIAVFMTLVQLEIAVPIVTGAFYIVLGAIGLGAALAFGLGGTNSAQRLLDGAYDKGREAAPRMRAEYRVGKERAGERADQARQRIDEERAEVERAEWSATSAADWQPPEPRR